MILIALIAPQASLTLAFYVFSLFSVLLF